MGDKDTKLSIVIRTVDKATAGIQAINKRLDEATKPIRNLKDALGDLKGKSGLDDLVSGFKGVGSAIGDLLSKVAMVGGVAGVAVAGMLHLVGEFDDLGDKAERMGVSVDFLAQMRYAAERAGAPVESLDAGMQAFSVNLGKARAGAGRMLPFLMKINPAFAAQLKGAKSNEEAYDDLTVAMSKLKDPAKRAALAMATMGQADLAPLLSRGVKGNKELRAEHLKIAGSFATAAAAAGITDDALKNLGAATTGVKAALVTGLAPALTVIIGKLTEWLSGHREQIKEWAIEFGKKLPGAVDAIVDAIKGAVKWVGDLVEDLGGWKVAATLVAAVMAGPLLASVVKLSAALLTTPLGWVILSVTALIALFKVLKDHFGTMTAVVGTLAAALLGLFSVKRVVGFIDMIAKATKAMLGLGSASNAAGGVGGVGGKGRGVLGTVGMIAAPIAVASAISDATGGSVQDQARAKGWEGEEWDLRGAMGYLASKKDTRQSMGDVMAQSNATIAAATKTAETAKITIDVLNALPGMRVNMDPASTADVDLNVGHQMMPGAYP